MTSTFNMTAQETEAELAKRALPRKDAIALFTLGHRRWAVRRGTSKTFAIYDAAWNYMNDDYEYWVERNRAQFASISREVAS